MANYYSPETIQAMLDRIKERKQISDPQQVRPWTDFQPKQLSFQSTLDPTMYKQNQDAVMDADSQATALAMVKAQNRFNYDQLKQQQKLLHTAQQHAVKPQHYDIPTGGGGGGGFTGGGGGTSPEVTHTPGGADIHAPLHTYSFHGVNYTVNSSVAWRFQKLLQGLWKMGYHPVSIQGYNKRNIAGTSTPSLHSYGFAIDIDPGRNPVYHDSNPANDVFALPKSVGALAAKYGLSWGGSWHSYKDYMHFSVPYGGRQ